MRTFNKTIGIQIIQSLYIMSNVFFSDTDGYKRYMFFGLIKNNALCEFGKVISIIALVANVVLLVLQFIELNRINRKRQQ